MKMDRNEILSVFCPLDIHSTIPYITIEPAGSTH